MKKIVTCLAVLCLICGCQDKKNLIEILFPSSMVIDFKDGKYTIALEINNFNTVSKTELESSSDTSQVLIATGKGSSIEDALKDLEENQRSEINLSHVRSLILLPGTLENSVLKDICSYAAFDPNLRMDTAVYYSKEELKEIYSVNFQIGRSQLYTLTNSPEFKKVSLVLQSINIMQLAKAINDDQITVELPVLKVNDDKDTYISSDGESEQKVYEVSQLLYLNASENTHQAIDLDDLYGIQWISRHSNKVDVNIEVNEKAVHAYSSSVKAYIIFNPVTETYHLKGKANLVLTRDLDLRPIEVLQPYIEKEIHEQISHTYKKGLEKNLDIYNMRYKSMLFGKDIQPDEDNFIDELEIELQIKGSYISQN